MAKREQIYGGREQDEFRRSQDLFEDAMADMAIAEGKEVAHLRSLFQASMASPKDESKNLAVSDYIQELLRTGFSKSRVDSMTTRAMARVAIPDVTRITRTPSARCLRRQAKKGK